MGKLIIDSKTGRKQTIGERTLYAGMAAQQQLKTARRDQHEQTTEPEHFDWISLSHLAAIGHFTQPDTPKEHAGIPETAKQE
jgi:hypothetical protein